MNNLFNTPFETGLRAMLILSVIRSQGITVDHIAAYDFITIYGRNFNVSENNLHGDNDFSFSELSTKREICAAGIKEFVLDGLITVKRSQNGFLYSLTAAGKKYINTLDSDYKEQYLKIIATVHKKYARKKDAALLKEISEKAVGSLRR